MRGASPASPSGHRDFSATQLKLVRRTIARNCTDAEFEEFMAFAVQCALDPLRRQIAPLIVEAHDAQKRRLICWTTIDGLRVIAARQGDYRPMETSPIIETDADRADPATNPHGVIRAEVRAWKLRDGIWFAVSGEAWWDEYAPTVPERTGDEPLGTPNGRTLAPAWRRMGRLMIAKCAEAQALRRGWPDVLSGLYGQEELHSLHSDQRVANQEAFEPPQSGKGGEHRVLWFVFEPGGPFVPLRLSEALGALCARYQQAESLVDIEWFDRTNKASLQTYWEWSPDAAFKAKVFAEAHVAAHDKGGKRGGLDLVRRTRRGAVVKVPICPPPDKECRRRPSRRLVACVLEAQEDRCLGCQTVLSSAEFDHVIPLGLGGSNSPENWAALCPTCHRAKTRADLKRIAKAKRQRRFHETGRSRIATSTWRSPGHDNSFGRRLRKGMNGLITERCSCASCLSAKDKQT